MFVGPVTTLTLGSILLQPSGRTKLNWSTANIVGLEKLLGGAASPRLVARVDQS